MPAISTNQKTSSGPTYPGQPDSGVTVQGLANPYLQTTRGHHYGFRICLLSLTHLDEPQREMHNIASLHRAHTLFPPCLFVSRCSRVPGVLGRELNMDNPTVAVVSCCTVHQDRGALLLSDFPVITCRMAASLYRNLQLITIQSNGPDLVGQCRGLRVCSGSSSLASLANPYYAMGNLKCVACTHQHKCLPCVARTGHSGQAGWCYGNI